jgi:hypothetical protein
MSDEINIMKRSESSELPKRGKCVLVSDEILQVSYFLHYFILSWRREFYKFVYYHYHFVSIRHFMTSFSPSSPKTWRKRCHEMSDADKMIMIINKLL